MPIRLEPYYNSDGTQKGFRSVANLPVAVYLKLNLPSKKDLSLKEESGKPTQKDNRR